MWSLGRITTSQVATVAKEACIPSNRLSRHQRLTHRSDFTETFSQGRHWVGRRMVVWVRRGPGACQRLGVVASRKVGGAVARTKAKRRLREVYRHRRHLLKPDIDVVIVARRAILKAKHTEVEEEFQNLVAKANLLRNW